MYNVSIKQAIKTENEMRLELTKDEFGFAMRGLSRLGQAPEFSEAAVSTLYDHIHEKQGTSDFRPSMAYIRRFRERDQDALRRVSDVMWIDMSMGELEGILKSSGRVFAVLPCFEDGDDPENCAPVSLLVQYEER